VSGLTGFLKIQFYGLAGWAKCWLKDTGRKNGWRTVMGLVFTVFGGKFLYSYWLTSLRCCGLTDWCIYLFRAEETGRVCDNFMKKLRFHCWREDFVKCLIVFSYISGRNLRMFQRRLLMPLSGRILEALSSSETLVDFYHTTRHNIVEDIFKLAVTRTWYLLWYCPRILGLTHQICVECLNVDWRVVSWF
jgi:hypothetical protein